MDDLCRAAAEAPDKVALIGWREHQHTLTRITFGDLSTRVDRLAAGLVKMGIRTADRVASYLPNCWESVALTLACARIGAVAVPVMLYFAPRDLERILAATSSVLCVAMPANGIDAEQVLAEMAPRLPTLRHRLVIDDSPTAPSLVDLVEQYGTASPQLPEHVDPNAPAFIFFTSGTTGVSKGVVHSQNTLFAAVVGFRALGGEGIGFGDVLAYPGNLPSALGTLCCVVWPLVERGVAVISDVREPQLWQELMTEHDVTCMHGSPAAIAELGAERPSLRRQESLRLVVSSGAPMTRESLLAAGRMGGRLVNLWGMTETQGGASTVDTVTVETMSKMGLPLPGVQARIENPDSGAAGELYIRGPAVCQVVFGRDTGEVLWEKTFEDGWFHTGDIVTEAHDGVLTFVGRTTDRVMSVVGMMIPTLEVEEELKMHPAILDAALINHPDAGLDHPCAVVVVRPAGETPDLGDVRSFLLSRGMTAEYLPSRLSVATELPRDVLGKIRRNVVRAQLAAGELSVTG